MSAPRAKNKSTAPVRTVSVTNPGDSSSATRQNGFGTGSAPIASQGGNQSVGAVAGRPSTKVVKGANPGVSVANSGNAMGSQKAMGGYPARGSAPAKKRNITSAP